MFIIVNTNLEDETFCRFADETLQAFPGTHGEIYNRWQSFIFRMKEKRRNTRLIIICVRDDEILRQIGSNKEHFHDLDVILMVTEGMKPNIRQLSGFFPRFVFSIGEENALMLDFIRKKIDQDAESSF